MFVNKALFETEGVETNEITKMDIKPRPPSSHNTSRQKLVERRKLIASQNRAKGPNTKRLKTKIIKKNVDIHISHNNLTVFNQNMKDLSTSPITKPIENIENNNTRSNSIMFGLSDHHKGNNGVLSSPSSIASREDSVQNIQIIDNYTHSLPSRQSTGEHKTEGMNDETITNIDDIQTFLQSPVPDNKIIQTYIVRNKSGLSNRLYPSYRVYLKDTKNFLMFAKKKQKNRTSNYIITTDPKKLEKNNHTYLGKVRGNFVGTEFVIYDQGRSPKDEETQTKLRSELGVILYETNILGTKGPRKMTILLPQLHTMNTNKWQQTDPKASAAMLTSTYKQNVPDLLSILQNKSPKWNENIGAYVLNFNGRVTMASVKNFQLVFPKKDENQQDVILQFGRVGKDRFTMDVRHPLTPLQAFAICLTSFDNKLACE